MKQGKIDCRHSKSEEQYICLAETCMKEYAQLDCLNCLQRSHPHFECLYHIYDVFQGAQMKQIKLIENINTYMENNDKLKKELEQSKKTIMKNIHLWVEKQFLIASEQIGRYENYLENEKKMIESFTISKNEKDLSSLINVYRLDIFKFQQQHYQLQNILQSNNDQVDQFFQLLKERIEENQICQVLKTEDFPKLQQQREIPGKIKYEICCSAGCENLPKSIFCLERTCAKTNTFQCPVCISENHYQQKKKSHTSYFLSAEQLWQLQDAQIQDLQQVCQKQMKNIVENHEKFQNQILRYSQINEQKLQALKFFFFQKKNEIIVHLNNIETKYQKGKFEIYRDLLNERNINYIAADSFQMVENFLDLVKSFNEQFESENELNQINFQELWLNRNCILQSSNLVQNRQNFSSSISTYIQEKLDQISELKIQNQQKSLIIEQQNFDIFALKRKSYSAKLIKKLRLLIVSATQSTCNYIRIFMTYPFQVLGFVIAKLFQITFYFIKNLIILIIETVQEFISCTVKLILSPFYLLIYIILKFLELILVIVNLINSFCQLIIEFYKYLPYTCKRVYSSLKRMARKHAQSIKKILLAFTTGFLLFGLMKELCEF